MIVLCYHNLSDHVENPWTLSPKEFRGHLEILAARGYHVMTLDDLRIRASHDDRAVVITFDDGREGCHRYVSGLLDEFGYTATFYICTNFVESNKVPACEAYSRFMTWNHIRELAMKGHTVGSHAVTHRSLRDLATAQRKEELAVSKLVIESKLDRPCQHFAAPYGYVDSALCDLARSAGYASVASTVFGVNRGSALPSFLRRWEVKSPCPREEFAQTLEQLDREGTEYRALLITKVTTQEALSLEKMAEYDLVISTDVDVSRLLRLHGLRCVTPDDVAPTPAGRTLGAADSEVMSDALKQRGDIPLDATVRFDFF